MNYPSHPHPSSDRRPSEPCDFVLGSDAARAVARFRADGPSGFRAKSAPGVPDRLTRAAAERDEHDYVCGCRREVLLSRAALQDELDRLGVGHVIRIAGVAS